MVDVLLNEHWSDGFNLLKKANIKHSSDGLNSLKKTNIEKKSLKTCLLKIYIGYCIIKWKPASQGMRQRMDKVHGSNLNFLIIIEHCIYTRMNTAQWHVTDNKTFSLIRTHLCWLSDIQTQLSVTRNCIKRVVFSSKSTALRQRYLSLSRVELHPMTILSPYVEWTEYYHVLKETYNMLKLPTRWTLFGSSFHDRYISST